MPDPIGKLPTFFILGARRAGTASLAHYLDQHTMLHFTDPLDPDFFLHEELFRCGPDYYGRTFCQHIGANPASNSWLGEASPAYFAYPESVAPRLAETYGDTPPKFVVLLREPVSRAWSHYLMRVNHGYEKRDFATALAREEKSAHKVGTERHPRYFAEGCYAALIQTWHAHFAPDRFLFLLSEDLAANPLAQAQQVFKWLGVDSTVPLNVSQRFNVARYSRSPKLVNFLNNPPEWASNLSRTIWPESWHRRRIRHQLRERLQATYPALPPIDPAIAAELRQRYRGEILALSKLLGRYLSHWLTDEPAGSVTRTQPPADI
jgi:hypothetical protein